MGEVERIAGDLPRHIRSAILESVNDLTLRGYAISRVLELGLAKYVSISATRNRLELTPFGLAVRDYLLRNPDA